MSTDGNSTTDSFLLRCSGLRHVRVTFPESRFIPSCGCMVNLSGGDLIMPPHTHTDTSRKGSVYLCAHVYDCVQESVLCLELISFVASGR